MGCKGTAFFEKNKYSENINKIFLNLIEFQL